MSGDLLREKAGGRLALRAVYHLDGLRSEDDTESSYFS